MEITTDHQKIQRWVESHQGQPEVIGDPGAGADRHSLRIDFPGKDDNLYLSEHTKEIPLPWAEFFERFERMRLAFMYNPRPKGRDLSLAYGFIKRELADEE